MTSNNIADHYEDLKKSVVTLGCVEYTLAILHAQFPVPQMRGEDSQAWIKGAEKVRNSSALHSLYDNPLWVLTMEFLSLQNKGSASHCLTHHEGCYRFVPQRRGTHIHTVFMPLSLRVLDTLSGFIQIWQTS